MVTCYRHGGYHLDGNELGVVIMCSGVVQLIWQVNHTHKTSNQQSNNSRAGVNLDYTTVTGHDSVIHTHTHIYIYIIIYNIQCNKHV